MSKYIIEIEEKPLCVFDKDTQTYFPRLWRVKGFNSLVLDEEGLSRLDELNSDYINEHYGSLQDDAYQKGFEDGKAQSKRGCEGCKYQANSELTCPCSECANNFKNQWAANDDKIEVGDWVNIKNTDEELGIVTKEHGNQFYILWADGSSGLWSSKGVVKTGRHFDIDKILDEMKGTRTDDDTY